MLSQVVEVYCFPACVLVTPHHQLFQHFICEWTGCLEAVCGLWVLNTTGWTGKEIQVQCHKRKATLEAQKVFADQLHWFIHDTATGFANQFIKLNLWRQKPV